MDGDNSRVTWDLDKTCKASNVTARYGVTALQCPATRLQRTISISRFQMAMESMEVHSISSVGCMCMGSILQMFISYKLSAWDHRSHGFTGT
jgi:hypothetical protein